MQVSAMIHVCMILGRFGEIVFFFRSVFEGEAEGLSNLWSSLYFFPLTCRFLAHLYS